MDIFVFIHLFTMIEHILQKEIELWIISFILVYHIKVRNLLLDLLKHNRYYFENDIPDDERVKMYIKDDDIKYSMLAKLIMGKCICS